MSPPVPTSEVTELISPLLGRESGEVLGMPAAGFDVSDDVADLQLMHGVDHRGRGASACKFEAGSGHVSEVQSAAAVLGRHQS